MKSILTITIGLMTVMSLNAQTDVTQGDDNGYPPASEVVQGDDTGNADPNNGETQSGTCGENLTWSYVEATKTLTISGTGQMFNYDSSPSWSCAPWHKYGNKIYKVIVESGVNSIGSYAFYELNLTSATIPNSVTSIGNEAFYRCTNLTSVIIGSGVTSIGSNAFYGTNLKKTIWLTNTPPTGYSNARGTVNYVSNDQFSFSNQVKYQFLSSYFEVDGIRYVPVSPSEKTCDAIDCVYDESAANTKISSTVMYKGVTLNVKEIKPYLAFNNKYIKSLIVDYDGEIPDHAFDICSNIQSVSLGQKVSAIGSSAFYGCSSMETIDIPDIVTTLNDWTFANCTSLKEIKIKPKMTDIKNSVFNNCTSLVKVIFADSEAELNLGYNKVNYNYSPLFSSCPLDSVYIGRNINYNTSSSYGYSPFYRSKSLRAVKITDKETEISENEFYGCTNLQRVIIGDGVTTIGNWAFSGCSSLKYFAFGSKVDNIGQEAFSDCSSVIEISSKAQAAPLCGSQALDDINKWDCKLYVPEGCLAVYQSADQWRDFFFTEVGEGTASQSDSGPFEPNKCEMPTISMNGDKVTFGCKTDGVTFHYSISSSDAQIGVGNQDVELKKTLTITVYATKDGYSDSDVAKSEFKISGSGIPGDVNNDGKVNATDHVVLSNIILNK